MSIEELKKIFCKNDELIKDLKSTEEKINKKLKELTREITELEEYKQYINDVESEEKRLKLINTEPYKKFLELKKELDVIKTKIADEETRFTKEEFEEIIKQSECNHLFYNINEEERECIKCNYRIGRKNKTSNIKDLRSSFLYIELSPTEKQNENISEFLQVEELKHLNSLTNQILKIYPNINNEELQRRLEEKIAEENIEYITAMYEDVKDMPEDTKESYISYKNRLKK